MAMTDDEPTVAQSYVNELLQQAWQARGDFVYQIEDLGTSMQRAETAAAAPGTGPVIVLNHYDNTASGGTMDTTEVLSAILEAGLQRVAVFGFYDPDIVDQMAAAGVGATVTVDLGGNYQCRRCRSRASPYA